MSLALEPGHHVLHLRVRTPVNVGDSGGTATLDRPVALDTWEGLPYLPGSSLKGVLAGLADAGSATGGKVDSRREALFGAPDRPGPVVVGDGELLAFPVPLRDGSRAAVVVARGLFALARDGHVELPGLRAAERADAYAGDIEPWLLPAPAHPVDLGVDLRRLAGLFDSGPLARLPCLVAAGGLAADLWRSAAEERTLTALGSGRTVLGGSLRTVELIPAGASFLCRVTSQVSSPVLLADSGPLQIGAFEGSGCGFVDFGKWRAAAAPDGEGAPPGRFAARPAEAPEHEIMQRSFEAVREIAASPSAQVARSAIFDFGPRLEILGLPRTLAFCLAKAGGIAKAGEIEEEGFRGSRRERERRAYRWLLASLLAPGEAIGEEGVRQRAIALVDGSAEPPATLGRTVFWLRRFAETQLEKEEGQHGDD